MEREMTPTSFASEAGQSFKAPRVARVSGEKQVALKTMTSPREESPMRREQNRQPGFALGEKKPIQKLPWESFSQNMPKNEDFSKSDKVGEEKIDTRQPFEKNVDNVSRRVEDIMRENEVSEKGDLRLALETVYVLSMVLKQMLEAQDEKAEEERQSLIELLIKLMGKAMQLTLEDVTPEKEANKNLTF